jgi:plasmid stabilization system protein ParE
MVLTPNEGQKTWTKQSLYSLEKKILELRNFTTLHFLTYYDCCRLQIKNPVLERVYTSEIIVELKDARELQPEYRFNLTTRGSKIQVKKLTSVKNGSLQSSNKLSDSNKVLAKALDSGSKPSEIIPDRRPVLYETHRNLANDAGDDDDQVLSVSINNTEIKMAIAPQAQIDKRNEI